MTVSRKGVSTNFRDQNGCGWKTKQYHRWVQLYIHSKNQPTKTMCTLHARQQIQRKQQDLYSFKHTNCILMFCITYLFIFDTQTIGQEKSTQCTKSKYQTDLLACSQKPNAHCQMIKADASLLLSRILLWIRNIQLNINWQH
jgi:hypothetical protein